MKYCKNNPSFKIIIVVANAIAFNPWVIIGLIKYNCRWCIRPLLFGIVIAVPQKYCISKKVVFFLIKLVAFCFCDGYDDYNSSNDTTDQSVDYVYNETETDYPPYDTGTSIFCYPSL